MQWTTLIDYISRILSRGHYFEMHDVNGKRVSENRITNLHLLTILLGLISPLVVRNGFSPDFAGYTVGFLGIFVGLFASIVLSMYDKRLQVLNEIREREVTPEARNEKVEDDPDVKARLKKARNHLKQFTALTSVSILKAFFLIIFLLLVLLFPSLSLNPFGHHLITEADDLTLASIWMGIKLLIVILHRAGTVYLLTRFFLISMYAISSYFSFLNSQYKRL